MKTPVTHEEMISMFASQQLAILEINNSMKTAINATTKMEIHKIELKMNSLDDKQQAQNDQVAKNKKCIVVMKRTLGVVGWLEGHLRLCFLALFGFCYLTAMIYSKVNITELFVSIFNWIFKL